MHTRECMKKRLLYVNPTLDIPFVPFATLVLVQVSYVSLPGSNLRAQVRVTQAAGVEAKIWPRLRFRKCKALHDYLFEAYGLIILEHHGGWCLIL